MEHRTQNCWPESSLITGAKKEISCWQLSFFVPRAMRWDGASHRIAGSYTSSWMSGAISEIRYLQLSFFAARALKQLTALSLFS